MYLRVVRLSVSMAALLMVLACGGSTSPTSSSPAPAANSSPSIDPAAAYKALVSRVDGVLHDPPFLRYCQPIKPSSSALCRASVVRLVSDDNDALGLLDGATVPDRFKTVHAALRASVVDDLAINSRAVTAIDSGKDTQAVLDASLRNYFAQIAPVVSQILAG